MNTGDARTAAVPEQTSACMRGEGAVGSESSCLRASAPAAPLGAQGGMMERYDFELFGLRLRFKRNAEGDAYLFVENVASGARGWYLTIPLSPLRKGADAGHYRPHLSRGRNGRKKRQALDASTLMPFPVANADWRGALKLTPTDVEEFFRAIEPMGAEIAALRHYEEFNYDDAMLRQLVVAVYAPDAEASARLNDRIEEQIERDRRFVVDTSSVADFSREYNAFWRSPVYLDVLAPGTQESPVTVKFRGACGHELETEVYRREDGVWVERRYCCPGDEAKRREIIERYLGPNAEAALTTIMRLLGFAAPEARQVRSDDVPRDHNEHEPEDGPR